MTILVIVESPAKCKKIENYLGNGYKCIASFGHIRQLGDRKDGLKCIDIKNNYKPNFKLLPEKSKYIKKLRDNIKKASEIILATDDDREGEAIAWHICKVFNLPINTTKRIIFHEITKSAIKNAVNNYTYLDMNKVHAQQSRQILDKLVGYTLTPLLWKHISRNSKTSLSAGRCQTPALRLVYELQKEINKSPGRKVYETEGEFTDFNITFKLNKSYESEDNIVEFLEESVNHEHIFNLTKPKNVEKKPPLPFTTSTLQQNSSNNLHYSPKQTMRLAQTLYEAGYITYMRTDSKTYSSEFIKKTSAYIKKLYDETYISKNLSFITTGSKVKKKKKDDKSQEAHEAIRPTDVNRKDIKIAGKITNKEKRLYNLIWCNTVKSCMSNAKYKSITGEITSAKLKSERKNHLYKCIEEKCLFPGWQVIDGITKDYSSDNYENLLKIKKKSVVAYTELRSKVTMKDLKSHYTEARLIQQLEKRGIGRPSTFSSLISKIQEREYVKKEDVKGKKILCTDFRLRDDELEEYENNRVFGNEKNKLVIQPIGVLGIEFLLKYFNPMFEYEYTKNMEDALDIIALGNKVWYSLCEDCYKEMFTLKEKITVDKIEFKIDEYHTYTIARYGPVIKYVNGNEKSFKPVKKDLDMDKLRNGEYNLEEILETKNASDKLGDYNGFPVYVKNGKYGAYINHNKKNTSIKSLLKKKNISNITLEDVLPYLKNEVKQKNILKILNEDISIRTGKYGPYVFYKTERMKKPKFINIKNKNYNDVTIEWVNEQI